MSKFIVAVAMTVLLFGGGLLVFRFIVGGGEDSWICQNNVWVEHGNPSSPQPSTGCGTESKTGLANPASVFCIEQGGTLDIVTEASSSGEIGICKFADGKSCEEWDFFRTRVCTSTNSAQQK